MARKRMGLIEVMFHLSRAYGIPVGKGKEKLPGAWKPQFTEEELTHLRTLPKKEREAEVKRLRAKYLNSSKEMK